jgi:rhodanese-related sulfurtransferase
MRSTGTLATLSSANHRRKAMVRFAIARMGIMLVSLIASIPFQQAIAREWIDPPVIAAAGRVLAEMPDDYYRIGPAAAFREIASAAPLMLDVREASEFVIERLAVARNIPIRQLAKAIDTLPENKAAPIIVYCVSGHRGAIALTVLRMAGYTNVRSLTGGLDAWKAAGLPVVK